MSQAVVNEQVKDILRLQENRLADEWVRIRAEKNAAKKLRVQGEELARLALMLPLYCQPLSVYYRDSELLTVMEETAQAFLGTQLPSGNVSLYFCNIDSPPDTAFTSHLTATLAQLAIRDAGPEASNVTEALLLFLRRAAPALLSGGIHTPNHRWVMASALAKMEELFGGAEYRRRAFQFLDEGLDITDYGEWTERSNAFYNAICSYYLYTVGRTFDYRPAMEAASSTLRMMRYLLHPGDTIATEYSGRQDLGQVLRMDDRYYVAYHLLAAHDRDPVLAGMAGVAARTAPRGSLALLHWMLEPERMELPERAAEPEDSYTVLFGENNRVPVPDRVWYAGPVVKHPHGASVLRHRRGKLSVTGMAGQPECLYLQYGEARMLGMKLGVGWFGVGAASFPGISKTAEDTYRMEVELEGCYFGPLAEEQYKPANGVYVNMPNHLRERVGVVRTRIALEIKLYDDGIDVRALSDDPRGIYLQAVCMFDPAGELSGANLTETETAKATKRLSEGEALFRVGDDCIRIEGGAYEHDEPTMRNDPIHLGAQNMTVSWMTPTDATLKFRCFDASDAGYRASAAG